MTRVDTGQPFSVVVDYAHTPEAMEKVLTLLRGLHPSGRVIAVFGSAGERDVEKRSLQGAIAARLADVSVITSEDPRFEDADAIIAQIAAGARRRARKWGNPVLPHRPTGRYPTGTRSREPGDCVLLGGKGHEGSIIWGREKLPWDEAGVARELLLSGQFGDSGGLLNGLRLVAVRIPKRTDRSADTDNPRSSICSRPTASGASNMRSRPR